MHVNHLGILLKCRFYVADLEWGLSLYVSNISQAIPMLPVHHLILSSMACMGFLHLCYIITSWKLPGRYYYNTRFSHGKQMEKGS